MLNLSDPYLDFPYLLLPLCTTWLVLTGVNVSLIIGGWLNPTSGS